MPVPEVQAGAGRGLQEVPGRGTRPSPPDADRVRAPEVEVDQRPRRLPQRRACRLVRRRAAYGLPGPPARLPRPLGRPERGQGRRHGLGRDLLRRPRGISPPPRQLRARARRCRLRAATRRPCSRGLPDDHAARQGDHLGRAPRRQPQHLRRRRVRQGQSADPAPRRDAHRLLGGSEFLAWRRPTRRNGALRRHGRRQVLTPRPSRAGRLQEWRWHPRSGLRSGR